MAALPVKGPMLPILMVVSVTPRSSADAAPHPAANANATAAV